MWKAQFIVKYGPCQLVLSEEYGGGMQIIPEQCRLVCARCLHPPCSHRSLITGQGRPTRQGNSPASSHSGASLALPLLVLVLSICHVCLTSSLLFLLLKACVPFIYLISNNETWLFSPRKFVGGRSEKAQENNTESLQ